MNKHWINSYDAGVPEEINPDAYSSIVAMFEDSAAKYADEIAYQCFGQAMTYAQLEQQSRAFAAFLQTELGMRRGDRVALMCPNIFAFPVAMLGQKTYLF